jgi:4-alpha-glucanotransferase
MNIPGTVGDHNWSWRFTWDMLGNEPARVLGLIATTSGRNARRTDNQT